METASAIEGNPGQIDVASRWQDAQDAGNPDELLICPYDPHHLVRACRFPYHLIKCQKNHPELAKKLKTCPFNARHLMKKSELSHHIITCPDRCSVDRSYISNQASEGKFHVPLSPWAAPKCEEDWDKEASGTIEPFVWSSSVPQYLENRESSGEISLRAGFRTPRSLPWKLNF